MDEVDSARRERAKNSLATEDGEDATESFVAPDPRLDPTGDPRRRVYLVSHGWHTGIVVRRADIPTGVWPESEDFPGAEYLEVGWGERDYYQTREPGVWLTFKAALWPTPSVLHIVSFSGPVSSYFQHSEVIELELTQSGIEHLSGFVHDSFDRDGAVRSGQLGRGLYGHSAFYPAREKFHLQCLDGARSARRGSTVHAVFRDHDGQRDVSGASVRQDDSENYRVGLVHKAVFWLSQVVGSQNRSAPESLSFSFRYSIDQRPMIVRIQPKNQSRIEQ
jgi:uncharacterized protein (TIGR02117 family)